MTTWNGIWPAHIGFALIVVGFAATCFSVGQHPASSFQFASVPGGELEYAVRGQGDPVLLIHGAFIAELLRPLAEEPALLGYRLIRVHRRGYAGSSSVGDSFSVAQDAADAAALLGHLGIVRAHVVAHSAGGTVAMEFAATFPEMVQTLTLLDPPLWFTKVRTLQPRTDGADGVEALILEKGSPDVFERLELKIPGALQQARRDERRFNIVEWTALAEWDFDETKARRITAPVFFIAPKHNENVELAKGWWPDMEFVQLSGATHMFPFEEPAATAQIIAVFLSQNPM